MAAENKPKPVSAVKSKKGRQRYLPFNKPVKKKGGYPLKPGVEGFFITCDGGRERQAVREAIDVIDSFREELIIGKAAPDGMPAVIPSKPLNKKITFSYSDSSSSDDDDDDDEEEEEEVKEKENNKSSLPGEDGETNKESETLDPTKNDVGNKNEAKSNEEEEVVKTQGTDKNETEEPPAKKQCLEGNVPQMNPCKAKEKSVDQLIEEEIKEFGDKSKRRFLHLDTGCNGVVFVQMRKKDGDPSTTDIVQQIMTSAAATKKHMSRFILRILPVEVSCYASEEEISRAIVPLVAKYFPADTQNPQKFAVLYGARANTGIDRMKLITAVAKSIPAPHSVDLNQPDKAIVVEIVKTVCLIGVVEKYKELAKYNLRQLTSQKP